MELDDLKLAWQTLDRRLEQQSALNIAIFRQGRLDRMRSNLRPLVAGQFVQMAVGLVMSLWAAGFWSQHRDVAHLWIAGLIVHAAGLSMILFSATMLALIARIDYSAPVLAIQRQLAQLRRFYVRGGILIGLPWSIIWIPFVAMVFKSQFGVDLYANAPSVLYIGIVVGAGIMLIVWLVQRWSKRRPQLHRKLEDAAAGTSLVNAQRILDDIRRFELD